MKKILWFFLICLIRLKNVMSIRIVSYIFDVKNYVFYFIKDLYMKPSDLLINLQINLGKKYKKNKEAYALFLNLLVLGMRDMFT